MALLMEQASDPTMPQRIKRGLIDYWPLATDGAVDLRSARYQTDPHDLTNNNGVTRAAGPGPNLPDAASFASASSQCLTFPSAKFQPGRSPFCISMWLRMDGLTGNKGIIGPSVASAASSGIAWWLRQQDNALLFRVSDGTTTVSSTSTNLSDKTWYFVTCGWDGIAVFIRTNDDPADIRAAFAGPVNPNTSDVIVGARRTDLEFFNGQITHIGYWARCLTREEGSYLYNNGAGRNLLRGC